MKAFLVSLLVIVALVFVGGVAALGYYLYQQKMTPPVYPSSLFTNTNATSTTPMATSTPPSLYATSTADMSSWKSYSNAELGFSVKYPADLILNQSDSAIILAFSKTTYFHWPLQDDAKVTITAATSCAPMVVSAQPFSAPTTTIMLNRHIFTGHEGDDVAAGNLYHEIAFDTLGNGACYHISLFDHGANGAGLYVSDPSLIAQYNSQHDADLAAVTDIFNGMLQTFTITTIPGGLSETQVPKK